MSNSFFRREVVGVGLGEGHRSGCGAVENSRPSANGLNRLLRPNVCWLTVLFFKDRGDLQICPSLHLRRRRCWLPHPGQSLCFTSNFADCANSGSTSTILCCTTAATRTPKTVLARSTGRGARNGVFPQRHQDGDCQVNEWADFPTD